MKSRLFSTTSTIRKVPTPSHYDYYTMVGKSKWTTLFKVTGRHLNFFQAIQHQPINTYKDLLNVLKTNNQVATNTLFQAILINRYQQLIPEQAAELMSFIALRNKSHEKTPFYRIYEMAENIIVSRNQVADFNSIVKNRK